MATRGLTLGGDFGMLPKLVADAEARGFANVWVSETSQSATVQAAVLAGASNHIDIGTNITLAFPRSPTVTAMEAWDLNAFTDGRFIVGLGSQVRRIINERFSAEFDRPAKRMAEYVQAMQAAWRMERGERTTFAGEIYKVLRPGLAGLGTYTDRPLPRVYVAAVGPLMTATAATYADGILGHPFTSYRHLTRGWIPRIDDALAKADRLREEFTICQNLIVSIAERRDDAVHDAKLQIAFYGSTPNYRDVFASYGDDGLTDELRRVFRDSEGDPEAMVAAVPDEAVDRYAVAGTPDEIADRLATFEAVVDHVILGGPWYGIHPARLAENHTAIAETLAPAANR